MKHAVHDLFDQLPIGRPLCWQHRMDTAYLGLSGPQATDEVGGKDKLEPFIDPFCFRRLVLIVSGFPFCLSRIALVFRTLLKMANEFSGFCIFSAEEGVEGIATTGPSAARASYRDFECGFSRSIQPSTLSWGTWIEDLFSIGCFESFASASSLQASLGRHARRSAQLDTSNFLVNDTLDPCDPLNFPGCWRTVAIVRCTKSLLALGSFFTLWLLRFL